MSRFDASQCVYWLINSPRIPFPRNTGSACRHSYSAEEAFSLRTNVFQLSWSNPFSIVFMYFCLALPGLQWLPVCLEAHKHKSDLLETFSWILLHSPSNRWIEHCPGWCLSALKMNLFSVGVQNIFAIITDRYKSGVEKLLHWSVYIF